MRYYLYAIMALSLSLSLFGCITDQEDTFLPAEPPLSSELQARAAPGGGEAPTTYDCDCLLKVTAVGVTGGSFNVASLDVDIYGGLLEKNCDGDPVIDQNFTSTIFIPIDAADGSGYNFELGVRSLNQMQSTVGSFQFEITCPVATANLEVATVNGEQIWPPQGGIASIPLTEIDVAYPDYAIVEDELQNSEILYDCPQYIHCNPPFPGGF